MGDSEQQHTEIVIVDERTLRIYGFPRLSGREHL